MSVPFLVWIFLIVQRARGGVTVPRDRSMRVRHLSLPLLFAAVLGCGRGDDQLILKDVSLPGLLAALPPRRSWPPRPDPAPSSPRARLDAHRSGPPARCVARRPTYVVTIEHAAPELDRGAPREPNGPTGI